MTTADTTGTGERRDPAERVATLDALYPGALALLLVRVCSPTEPHTHNGEECQSPGKVAFESRWNADALARYERNDHAERARHLLALARHIAGGGNVGLVVPPGVLVLDADNPESVAWLDLALPDAPMQESRPGRAHFVVRAPEGIEIRARTKVEILPGIAVDLRVAGRSQIAVEPSVHATGALYTWRRGL